MILKKANGCTFRIFAHLLLTLFFSGCTKTWPGYSMEFHPALAEDSHYLDTYKKWTQKNHFHKHMAEAYMFDVTFFSAEFRQSYMREWTLKKQLTLQEQKDLVSNEAEKSDKYLEFLLSLYISDPNKMDLGERKSRWSVYLVNPRGGRIEVNRIESLGKITSIDRYFFPHLSRWNEVFRLRFLKETDGTAFLSGVENEFQLVITGLDAEVKFAWSL